MNASDAESETIVTAPDPDPEPESEPTPPAVDPVEAFRKGKAKRETKRKQVKIIETHVPPVADELPPPPPREPPTIDSESIARRTAEIVLSAMGSKMATESEEVEAKPKRARTKKEVATPPNTNYFGWC